VDKFILNNPNDISLTMCSNVQRQQNVYYKILLYKILIFTEDTFELKGYFQ